MAQKKKRAAGVDNHMAVAVAKGSMSWHEWRSAANNGGLIDPVLGAETERAKEQKGDDNQTGSAFSLVDAARLGWPRALVSPVARGPSLVGEPARLTARGSCDLAPAHHPRAVDRRLGPGLGRSSATSPPSASSRRLLEPRRAGMAHYEEGAGRRAPHGRAFSSSPRGAAPAAPRGQPGGGVDPHALRLPRARDDVRAAAAVAGAPARRRR